MNDKILLILPTRGRPWSALEAIASVMKTADEPQHISIGMVQDSDDDGAMKFSLARSKGRFGVIESFIQEREPFARAANRAIMVNVLRGDYDWCAWIADDIRFRTKGWDTILRTHKELAVFGDDLYLNKPSHPFISTVIPKALGFLIPPELKHFCADGFIWALAGELKEIVHDPRIVTEHLHPDAGKAEMDETYHESKQYWESDLKAFNEVIRTRIAEWAQNVMDYRKANDTITTTR